MIPPTLPPQFDSDNRMRYVIFFFLVTTLPVVQADDYDASRLEVTELASGLMRPMELQVAPDGRVFFIELEGKMRVYNPNTGITSLVAEFEVFTKQENGLIGFALDPNFEETQHIFVQYSPPGYPGQHISRFELKDDKLDMQSEMLLLKFEEQRKECCHHSGSLQFGPDGCLFIGTGDNTHPGGDSHGYAPIDERPDRGPYDAQKSAANTHQRSGKILRIRPLPDGSYEVPAGNLFPADGSEGCPEIYVMGCRNPWRLNVDQKTGYLYWGEVGPDARNKGKRGPRGYDEVNQARHAGNFGWPYFIGDNEPYADVDFESGEIGAFYDPKQPINASPNNTGSRELPPATPALIYYPYDASEKFPELGSGGRTACAGPVYDFDEKLDSKNKFPKHFDRTLFIFEWSRHWIKAVHLDDDSNIESIEPFLADYQFKRPVDIEFGPDGAMYMLEYGETWGVNEDAKLIRVDYVSGNRKPIAVAKVENNVGREPLAVRFSSEGSFDKDSEDSLRYEWIRIETNEEKTVRKTIATTPNPTVSFEEPGVYNVELNIRDKAGALATASVPVLVGNAKASVKILEPVARFFEPGKPINFDIFVNDNEDGTNDYDLADEKDLPEIDGESATRVSMNARKLAGKFSMEDDETELPKGLQLMKGSDCFNCHDIRVKRVGPPLMEVAKKYRDDAHAMAKSEERVLNGSTGVWGKIPMIPHKQHTAEQIHAMVEWVYSLKEDAAMQVVRGFVGEIATDDKYSGGVELSASYTDLGVKKIPPITATKRLRLRSRHVEAEHANQIQGPQSLESEETANGGKFLGGINHNHLARFDDIPLGEVGSVTARVATGGDGGTIELRLDKPDGPSIAQFRVKKNDDWLAWWDETQTVKPTDGTHDVFVVFLKSGESSDALMNLDSLYFHPRTDR